MDEIFSVRVYSQITSFNLSFSFGSRFLNDDKTNSLYGDCILLKYRRDAERVMILKSCFAGVLIIGLFGELIFQVNIRNC